MWQGTLHTLSTPHFSLFLKHNFFVHCVKHQCLRGIRHYIIDTLASNTYLRFNKSQAHSSCQHNEETTNSATLCESCCLGIWGSPIHMVTTPAEAGGKKKKKENDKNTHRKHSPGRKPARQTKECLYSFVCPIQLNKPWLRKCDFTSTVAQVSEWVFRARRYTVDFFHHGCQKPYH